MKCVLPAMEEEIKLNTFNTFLRKYPVVCDAETVCEELDRNSVDNDGTEQTLRFST